MSNEIEFIKTRNGNSCLLLDGNRYRIVREKNEVITWRCVNNKKLKCRGSIKTSDSVLIEGSVKNHICTQNDAEMEVREKMYICKKRAAEDINIPIHDLYRQEFQVSTYLLNINQKYCEGTNLLFLIYLISKLFFINEKFLFLIYYLS